MGRYTYWVPASIETHSRDLIEMWPCKSSEGSGLVRWFLDPTQEPKPTRDFGFSALGMAASGESGQMVKFEMIEADKIQLEKYRALANLDRHVPWYEVLQSARSHVSGGTMSQVSYESVTSSGSFCATCFPVFLVLLLTGLIAAWIYFSRNGLPNFWVEWWRARMGTVEDEEQEGFDLEAGRDMEHLETEQEGYNWQVEEQRRLQASMYGQQSQLQTGAFR